MATRSNPAAATSAPNYTVPFIIVTALFCIFGFLTNLNNNLAPKLEDIFHLDHAWSSLVTSSWFFAYLFFSIPSAKVIEKVGYKQTMVISLFVMVVGAILFVPAANMTSFPFFLGASFVLATGVTGLQTSANPYVAILGPEHSAPARLNLAQAFNSAGNIVAPIIVGAFILTNSTVGMNEAAIAHTVVRPFIVVAVSLLVLGFIVMMLHLPDVNMARPQRPVVDPSAPVEADAPAQRSIWAHKHTVLAMFGIFMYVGLEVSLFAHAIRFFESQGSAVNDYVRIAQPFAHLVSRLYPQGIGEKEVVGMLAACYPLTMMIGRFAGTVVMKYIKAQHLLVALGIFGIALMVAAMFVTGHPAIWCVILCGLANSIMYPTIFALGIAELGPLTSKGSGIITQGCVGGAILPVIFGYLADKWHYQHAFLLIVAGYIFIVYFGLSGYKPERQIA